MSAALKKSISTRELTFSRKKMLNFIAQRSSPTLFQTCIKTYPYSEECVFTKADWNQNWFLATDSSEPSEETNRKQDLPFVQETQNLEKRSEDLLAKTNCDNPEPLSRLGMKLEESFPDDQRMQSALALYKKVDDCALENQNLRQNHSVILARFRLGLLHVLNNHCDQAVEVFTRLIQMGENDFTSRSFYWKAFCAKTAGKQEEIRNNFVDLFKVNPLGFHTLSIADGFSPLTKQLHEDVDPLLQTRSLIDEQYNLWIEAIEDMDAIGNRAGVIKLLSPVRFKPEYLLSLEPSVRLYLATFAHRAHDQFSVFRILDSIFRSHSDYVIDATLKLFFPIQYLQSISKKVVSVDPFLVIALIRQESAFQENIRSPVGATGLMQLMPATAKSLDHSVTVDGLSDPEKNLRIGIQFFESLVKHFKGNIDLALAAYNAGPGAVERWKARYPSAPQLLFLDLIPYSETRNYVALIERNYYWYSKIYGADLKH